jgi:hypothetical protein
MTEVDAGGESAGGKDDSFPWYLPVAALALVALTGFAIRSRR